MIPLRKDQIDNFKLPSLNGNVDTKKININIDEVLKDAIKNSDVTKDQATLLKKQYQDNADELVKLVEEFRKCRVNYLMSLSYDELDKAGLLAELQTKYLNGFQEKYFMRFGKHHASFKVNDKINDQAKEIELLAKFVVDNKDATAELVAAWRVNFKDHPERLLELLKGAAQTRVDELMAMEWKYLDEHELLQELKKKYFDGFKLKYKQKFGIDYKEQ